MTKKKPKPDVDEVAEVIGADDNMQPSAPPSVGIEAPSDGGILNRLSFSIENIIGEVAEEKLADMKAARNLKPWELLKEEDQRAMIEQAKARAEDLVERIVEALMEDGTAVDLTTGELSGGPEPEPAPEPAPAGASPSA